MLFVEGFRLLFVLAGSVAGYEIGQHLGRQSHAPLVGLLLGAAISYVLGGVAGRLLDKGLQKAVFLLRNTPPGEIFASSIDLHLRACCSAWWSGCRCWSSSDRASPLLITAGLVWVLASLGWRIGAGQGPPDPRGRRAVPDRVPPHDPPRQERRAARRQLRGDGPAPADPRPQRAAPGRAGGPPVRDRPPPVAGRGARPGQLPAGPPWARVHRGPAGDERAGARRSRRGSRGGRPRRQAAHRGPPHRSADRNLLDQR